MNCACCTCWWTATTSRRPRRRWVCRCTVSLSTRGTFTRSCRCIPNPKPWPRPCGSDWCADPYIHWLDAFDASAGSLPGKETTAMSKGGICISTLVVCASHTFIWAQSSAPLARGAGQSGSASDMSRIPAASRSVVTAALGSRDSRFRVQAESRGFHADNRPNGLAADFTRTGIELRRGGARFGLTLSGFGYGSALRAAGAADPQGSANRVEYQRGPLTEWYVNGPLGLEQGFTLKEQPGQRNGQPLTIALRLSGDLKASVGPDATSLTLSGSEGRTELRYTGLAARDSTRRGLDRNSV